MKSGFEIKNFDDLAKKIREDLPVYLNHTHRNSESSWQPFIDRLETIISILEGERPISEKVMVETGDALADKKDTLLTYACYVFLVEVEVKCNENKSKISSIFSIGYPTDPLNSTAYKHIASVLGMYDMKKSTPIPENKPDIQRQREIFTTFETFMNQVVYVKGNSKNNFLEEKERCFPVTIVDYLNLLSSKKSELEQLCNTSVAQTLQDAKAQEHAYLKAQEAAKAAQQPPKPAQQPEAAKSKFWKNPFASNKETAPESSEMLNP